VISPSSAQYLSEPLQKALTPFLVAILASFLAYIGWVQITKEVFGFVGKRQVTASYKDPLHNEKWGDNQASHKDWDSRENNGLKIQGTIIQIAQMILAFCFSFAVAALLTSSIEISVAISLLITAIPFFIAKRSAERRAKEREEAWPLAIDSLISSLQAGQSISEALQALSEYGPKALSLTFERVRKSLEEGELLEETLIREMQNLNTSASDQTITTLLIAKEFGGRDVTITLRLLSNFLRDDFEAQEEIKTKFGWVRNSALLGAGAPWLILLLLSTQENTVVAYQSDAGKAVLSFGVIATAIAFLWMERVARLPDSARPLKV